MTLRAYQIHFLPLQAQHLETMHSWLQEPHVIEFWDDGHRTVDQVMRHYFIQRDVKAYVITYDYLSVGYIQAYPVEHEHPLAQWMSERGETWGFDLFIGNKSYLNTGLSVPIIHEFMNLLLQNPAVKRIITDPEIRNIRAHHVYEKAGMQKAATDVLLGSQQHSVYFWDLDLGFFDD
jgi:RimJ/RimL family protein N-acetyltransferase